jgi:hypothetical protein
MNVNVFEFQECSGECAGWINLPDNLVTTCQNNLLDTTLQLSFQSDDCRIKEEQYQLVTKLKDFLTFCDIENEGCRKKQGAFCSVQSLRDSV